MFTVKNNSRGFTLIELLVVITIIGILATGGVAVFTTQIQKAVIQLVFKTKEAMKSAIEQAYQDSSTGEYPAYATLTVLYSKHISKDEVLRIRSQDNFVMQAVQQNQPVTICIP